MSRLANKMKAGYFPTPHRVAQYIAGHLIAPGSGAFRWLDPCAGEGAALDFLARVHGGETFGIELDAERAEVAARFLDHTLQGDYAAQQLPKGNNAGISVLFLNPPYDDDDTTGGRLELAFLRDTQDWLMPGGILIYLIPQYRISNYVAKRLAINFRDVRIYRFPDPEYDDFRQVVIFAIKRDLPRPDDQQTMQIIAARTAVLPVLPSSTDQRYRIPLKPEHPFYFRPAESDPKDVLAEAHEHGIWTTKAWTDLLTPVSNQAIQPLMPLRRGHIAMVLAAGLLDNMVVEREGQKLLVKGRLEKVVDDVTDTADRLKDIHRTRERFRAAISTLDLNTGEMAVMDDEAALRSWLTRWQGELASKIVGAFKPLHQMNYDGLPHFDNIVSSHSKHRRLAGRSRTGLFEAQKQVVAALVRRYMTGAKFATVQGDMGTGKTTIAASLADVLKKYYGNGEPFPVIVACPPHLVQKWIREIGQVIPLARAVEVRRPGDLEKYVQHLYNVPDGVLSVAVVSSEMLKLGSGWTTGVIRQPKRYRKFVEEEVDGEIVTSMVRLDTFACPRCGQTIYERDETGRPLYPITDPEYFSGGRRKCNNTIKVWRGNPRGEGQEGHWKEVPCNEPLYQDWRGKWITPERDGFGHLLPLPEVRYPIASYVKRRYKGLFELAIVDEVHEMKGQTTDRGHAFGTLVQASKRTLVMTGTLFGGFATSLFYLLHRLDGRLRSEFSWSDGQRFAALYGVLERIIKYKGGDPDDDDYGHYTGLRRRSVRTKEQPGISPALVTWLLDSTIFLTLADLGFELPKYAEHPVVLPMIEGNGTGPDQAETYKRLHDDLLEAAQKDWSLMSEYLQTTLAWPNACWRDEETSLGTVPALPARRLYPKEEWLVEKCLEEKRQGRKVLVYVRQTASRDIQPRLAELLGKAGLKVVTLRSSVGTSQREAWVKRQVKNGLDVLMCNANLVKTGLDLVDFPTVVFYEIEYSLYTVQQASRRTWRLGQTHPVDVYFAVYDATMEHRAVAHVGKKVAAAQLLYGDDIAGALVDQAGLGGSFLEDLAREVIANAAIPDLGELFVQQHNATESSGWLTGADQPHLVEQQAALAATVAPSRFNGVDPRHTVQLTMF